MKRLFAERDAGRRVLLALVVASVYCALCWRPHWMTLLGVSNMDIWFLDTRALLAASDAHALGIDPYGRNPLDLLQQPHVYSYWWFGLREFGLTRTDHVWLGALLGFTFLVFAMLHVRVRSWGEVAWSAAFITAPPIILGFNRGNVDLSIFILLCAVVPCLQSSRRALPWCGVGAIVLATGLKYYPAAAALLLLGATASRVARRWQILLCLLLFVLLAFDQASNTAHYLADHRPRRGFFTFGAAITAQLLSAPSWVGVATGLVLAGTAVPLLWFTSPAWTPTTSQRPDYLRFILGAVLLAACYFAAVNFSYRAVFAVWMAPLLWSAWQEAGWPSHYRRLARIVSILLCVFLWLDGVLCLAINLYGRLSVADVALWSDRLVLAEQPLAAALFIALLGFVVPFARDHLHELLSPASREGNPAIGT